MYDTSVPYCPETNGKIEREICTIKDCARTILISANLPTKLWAEAVGTTVYLHNRLLDKHSPTITAHEAVIGRKPSLAHVRAFGCQAYSHVPRQLRKTWDPKGIKCIMVGYSGDNRKYRLYDPVTNKIHEDRNATFLESNPEHISVVTEMEETPNDTQEVVLPTPWSIPIPEEAPVAPQSSDPAVIQRVQPLPGPSHVECSPRRIVHADPNLSNTSDLLFSDSDDENVTFHQAQDNSELTETNKLVQPPPTPVPNKSSTAAPQQPQASRSSRPDISFAVSRLAQFMNSYNESHWNAAKGILRYLKGTADMGITYHCSGDMELTAYTDSDYAGDKVTRKSTSGFVVMLNSSIITWSSQKQPCVSLSSTEAEYIALTSGAREIVWLRSFLEEMGYPQKGPTSILVDNQSAIRLTKNPEMHARTKHIDVRFHYVRELEANQLVHVEYVPTEDQLADSLTKPLLKGKLQHKRNRLGINNEDYNNYNKFCKNTIGPLKPSVIISLIALFIIADSATSHSPPVLWRKSHYPVTTGHAHVMLSIQLINPCDLMMVNNFHPGVASQAALKCEQLRKCKESFTTELSKICPKQYLGQLVKRFIDPISISIYIAIFASVVGVTALGVGTTALSEVHSVASHSTEQDKLINELENKVQKNHEAIRNLTIRFNSAMEDLQAQQRDYAEFKGKYVNSTFAITARLMMSRTIMQQSARQWKMGRVDPAFLDFFNVSLPCGDRCPIDLARSQKCSSTRTGDKILVEFAVQEISQDLILVEADPSSTRMHGNRNLPNGTNHFKIKHCHQPFQGDELEFLQVKPYNDVYHIYCPGSNLTIAGIQRPCPIDEVITIPMQTNFSINDMVFNSRQIKIEHHESLDPIFTTKANWIFQSNLNWTALELEVSATDDWHPDYIVPLNSSPWFWSTGFVSIIIIALVGVIIYLCHKRKQENLSPNTISVIALPSNHNLQMLPMSVDSA
ncbi:unnamed protein product [Allacma fusca]|uniref:Integrase catalytic domain-containing protein n=1 Tax=Allacma fusca TaxID=39272 RepID=A0A8J2NL05_9HEXA|nr:unnamed protein product [Allacma fusca]